MVVVKQYCKISMQWASQSPDFDATENLWSVLK